MRSGKCGTNSEPAKLLASEKMAQRITFPKEALEDISAVLRLSDDNLDYLARLIDEDYEFSDVFEVAAGELQIPPGDVRSVVSVAMFLRTAGARGASAEDITQAIRGVVEEFSDDEEKALLLDNLNRIQQKIHALAIPTPTWIRQKKVKRLANGPHSKYEFCRTACQLRPLFESDEEEDEDENIVGLVGNILVELHLRDPNDDDEIVVFSLDPSELDDLIKVFDRTRRKLAAIRRRYAGELLNLEERDDNG